MLMLSPGLRTHPVPPIATRQRNDMKPLAQGRRLAAVERARSAPGSRCLAIRGPRQPRRVGPEPLPDFTLLDLARRPDRQGIHEFDMLGHFPLSDPRSAIGDQFGRIGWSRQAL